MGPAAGSAAGGSRTPVVALQAALTAATTGEDKTVTVNGTSTSPVGTATLSGQEEFSPSFGLSMTDTEDGAAFSEIWIGDTVYLKVPQYAGMLGAGKSWFALDLAGSGPLGALFAGQIAALQGMNPAQMIESLIASGDVADAGQQTVDGMQTTHYTGTLDPATVADSAAAKKYLTPAQIQQLKEMAEGGGAADEKIDAWIAADNLPVRITISGTGTETGTATDSADTGTSQLDFSNWGRPVNIAAPPSDEVENPGSLGGSSNLPTGI